MRDVPQRRECPAAAHGSNSSYGVALMSYGPESETGATMSDAGDDAQGDARGSGEANRNAGDGIRATAAGRATVPLSVLDLVTVGAGSTAHAALRTSVEIARLAESAATTATGSPSTTPCPASPAPRRP